MQLTGARRRAGFEEREAPKDSQLLERIISPRPAGVRAAVPALSAAIVAVPVNIVNRPHVVEEVLDDTMMAVWNTAANFRGASKVSTWIFAIAYRQAVKARSRWDEPLPDLQDNDQASTGSPAGRAAAQQPQP